MSTRNHPSARDLAATDGLNLTKAERVAVFEANGIWPDVAEVVDRIVAGRLAPVEALITGWSGGSGHRDTDKWVTIAELKKALHPTPTPRPVAAEQTTPGTGGA